VVGIGPHRIGGPVTYWLHLGLGTHERITQDRLIAAETLKQGELARQRAEICDPARLERLAPSLNMVKAPVSGRVIAVRSVPAVEPSDTHVLNAAGGGTPQRSTPILPQLPAVEAGMTGCYFWW